MDIDQLIQKYLHSEITPEEREDLNRWLMEDDEHLRYFFRCQNLQDVYQPAFLPEGINGRKALREVLPVVTRRRRLIRRWTTAAAVALLCIGSAWIRHHRQEAEQASVQMVAVDPAPVSEVNPNEITLTFADGEAVNLSGEAAAEIRRAGGASAQVSAGGIAYEAQDSVPAEPVYHTLNVPRGKDFFLALNDGTKVWINAETEVRYPVRFAAHERKIFVKGEVYLEVARNVEAPFTVVTAQSEVTVLGTAFNVKSYGEEDSQITLVTGKVEVATGDEAVVLQPGEQAVVNAEGGEIATRQVDTDLYCAWHEGKLIFRNNSLEEILRLLARRYDMEVTWTSEDLKRLSYSGEIERQNRVEDVLKVVGHTDDVRFSVSNGTIIVHKP